MFRHHKFSSVAYTLLLTSALTGALTGCFGPRQVSASAADGTATPAPTSVTTTSPSSSSGASPTVPTGPTASTSSTSASTASASSRLARCRASGTTVSAAVEEGSGGAGSYSVTVSVYNRGKTCLLVGFPGVSMVTGDSGQQLGKPADRTGHRGEGFVLGHGQTGSTTVRVSQAGNYDPCEATQARGLRIYLPNETHAQFAPLDTLVGCADPRTPSLMHVKAFGE